MGRRYQKQTKKYTTYNIPHCTNLFSFFLRFCFFLLQYFSWISFFPLTLFIFYLYFFSVFVFDSEDPCREEQKNNGRSGVVADDDRYRAYYNRFLNGRTSGQDDGDPMSRRQLCSCLSDVIEESIWSFCDCFFPLRTAGSVSFWLFFFREMGRSCSYSGGCVGNVGLVGIFFFSLSFLFPRI